MHTQELVEKYGGMQDSLRFHALAAEIGMPAKLNAEFIEALREAKGGVFGVRTYRQGSQWDELRRTLGLQAALREGREATSEWQFTHNLVTNEGLGDLLTQYFKGSSYSAAGYVTLSSTNTAEAATMTAATPAFTEITTTDVTESTRQSWTGGSVSGTTTASIDNSVSVATYTCNTTGFTAYAAALFCSGATSAFANTSGVLYSYSLFASAKALSSTNTIDITYSFTATSA